MPDIDAADIFRAVGLLSALALAILALRNMKR
jgi:hypothetical protein